LKAILSARDFNNQSLVIKHTWLVAFTVRSVVAVSWALFWFWYQRCWLSGRRRRTRKKMGSSIKPHM
jgi:hypothetical protein